MKTVKHRAICIVLLAWAGTAMGAILHVPADYPTIQAAINAASNGDQIEVAPGAYYEVINFSGKAIRLYSSGDATNTTIDGGGIDHVVQCINSEGPATILEGFTITGGWADGGAGMCNSGSSPTVIDCAFSGNLAGYNGAGMGNYGSNPTLTNCTFSGNLAYCNGAGMYNYFSSPTLTNCTFSGNSGYDGGAMGNLHSSPTLANCTFSGNSAHYGSGMSNWYYISRPTVTNCTFIGNSASNDGGGMHNYNSSPTVANCTFSGNSAFNGAGMNNVGSSLAVTNCTFIGNSASDDGGGVYNLNSNPTVTNCTFSGNTATYNGTGMCNYNSSPTVTNCILWSDSGSVIYGSDVVVTYSDIQGGFAGTGNIDTDPQFVNAAGGDFHLLQGSPCIDMGTNSPAGGLPATDIEGNPRPADGDGDGVAVADMGAYEFAYVPANTPPEILAVNGPPDPIRANTMIDVEASFSDPDAGDTHTAVWDWGDGTPPTDGDVDEEAQTVGGSHTYATAGVFTVTVTVTDAAGASDTETLVLAVQDTFYLHGVAPDLTLDSVAPTGATAKYKDSPSVNRTTFKEIGTWTYVVPAEVNLQLDSSRDLYVWLGLKNSDDQWTYFDLRVELLKNGIPIATAETRNIQGITRNPDKAKEVVVALGGIADGGFSSGDVLAIRILTKVTATGGHSNAVGLRLYYDSLSRPSRFEPSSVP